MMFEEGHPNVTLSDWQAFKASETSRPSLIAEIVDRRDCGCLPDWFVPLARGVAIASDALLRRAGHRDGVRRRPGWREVDRHCYRQLTGGEGPNWPDVLIVRRCDKHEWWAIERRVADVDEVLVCSFGSTPIFTRSYQSAMRLAMHCNVDDPPHGLRWVKEAPDDCSGAIEFARRRRIGEAQPEGQLHKVA